ncbi:2-polyprenyl-6-methoxyphenol hydroxylase-like FAD-dependent oxidoreductase [Kitasatospora sp. SolWspMP-SS2h]|uniref:FAD-dependent oxidoreductase n=1 Tax=Kitasatospora sp. SolWspMP-SS2h TaxID=1305729 RepID=UPI000DB98DCD|nr:FAD-dependent oxidoreductase [Kitasatospora sp. SolWspMP-SS2h]RAJ37581.1 2-polyprenyl-6-methoxyphenol hydroxylase-like FAD-dependent oxidoreductase [Kitasatospora sp. SolWspMP-SS2h]
MSETEFTADVLVVGAGPTGLLLAGDLAAAGLRVTVLEKRAEESNLTRAFAVHARTLELLDARGLADELIATGRAMPSLQVFGRLRVDLAGLPTRFPFVLVTPQYHTERVLRERAVKAGADLRRGTEVTGLRQDGRGVTLTARAAGGERSFRARYAVGADGVHSAVRDLLGVPFPGESAVRSVMLADVRLEREPDEPLTAGAGEAGFAFLAPFGDGWYRVIGWSREHQVPDSDPVDPAELSDLLREVMGRDFGVREVRWTSRFHSDERQVPSYRSGRVFLAGDAAHCHSPAGGQGMNTGLQDAANLSWKLAAAVRGWAPDALLDTYQTERHPVGRAALRSSGALVRLAQGAHAPARALRSALGAAAGHLGPLAELGAKQVSGIGYAYPAEKGAHPLVGRRVPDLRLAVDAPGGPARLHEALRSGKAVLISNDELSVADSWAERVVTAAPADPHGKLRDTVLLVRPDGYAAWACADPTRGELRAALVQWLGRP